MWLGLLFIMLYNILGAGQEVFLGHLFQNESPVFVMVLLFSITATFFVSLKATDFGNYISLFRRYQKDITLLNLSTLASWLGFFVALEFLEPAIVGTTVFAVGPAFTLLIQRLARPSAVTLGFERIAAIGVIGSFAVLVLGTLGGASAIGQISVTDALWGLSMAMISGAGIAGNSVFSKKLSADDIDAKTVMALRFFLLIAVGLVLVAVNRPSIASDLSTFSWTIALLAIFTVIIPLYLVQRAIELCEPITIALLFTLSPVLTLVFQLFDTRLAPSLASWTGIALCVVFASLGVFSRTRRKAVVT